ncbi:MAG: GTP cyclohydrolase I FolE [bacterium]|jgi:GTP cyclohydrolase I
MKKVILNDEEINLSFETGVNLNKLYEIVKDFIKELGEDIDRDGLKRTPIRVAKAWAYLTKGYFQTLDKVIGKGIFEATNNDMIIVKDIEFYSLCEHHMLPFFGRVHIGYIPNRKILGISKFGRIVDMYSRRLQIQERLTHQIAEAINNSVNPLGVGVVVDGVHLCMMMRGIEKQNARTITSCMLGVFKENLKTREEFLNLINTSIKL